MIFHRSVSFIFHPVIVPIASALLYFIIIPKHIPKEFAYRVLGLIFISTYLVPLALLYFLKRIGLIYSYHMPTINERRFPILFLIVLCFLLGNLLLTSGVVDLLAYSLFACSLALTVVYVLFFLKIKTSLHTLGISGLIGFIMTLSLKYQLNLIALLVLLFLLLGLVATSRLKLKAHKPNEIGLGFFIGLTSQLLVYNLFLFYNI